MPVIARYAIATLVPLILLGLAAQFWGGFAWLALAWLTLGVALGDQLLAPPAPVSAKDAIWADRLSIGLGISHLALLFVVLDELTSGELTLGQTLALLAATASFFGQVSHPNAHELIHSGHRGLRALGAAVYTSVAFGHHVSAHRFVHHRHVGTDADPNTPLPGEGFWAYLPRAWRMGFEAGLTVEIDRLETRGRGDADVSNPYWIWVFGAVIARALSVVVAGPAGAVFYLILAALTGAQILMSDYIQHYGLQRLIGPDGRAEPVGPHHSWNAPRGMSTYVMMNAPAHSEHHMHPARSFGTRDPNGGGPTLPYAMPIMAVIALYPDGWRRVMDKRALKVMEQAEAALHSNTARAG